MALIPIAAAEALGRLESFDTVIDARSEAEFAEDRLPGAVNWPSLTDAERIRIGTMYVQQSAFDAKKVGAALVARNVAAHLERAVVDKPKGWAPLVYCWRGGKRSGALATVLDQIGFRVHLLEGGYREYRRAVLAALETLPATFDFRVVCGTTGSGKSRLLSVLPALGAQVLDLEALAEHRGSVLGLVPGRPQPTQKAFDSRLWDALRRLDASRPVVVESESKKIGDVRVAESLISAMRRSPCVWLELAPERRVDLLLDEYDFFARDPDAFCARLDALREVRGNATVDAWQSAARSGRTAEVVRDLLATHYDPIYLQSLRRNFAGIAAPALRAEWDGSAASLASAAHALVSHVAAVKPSVAEATSG